MSSKPKKLMEGWRFLQWQDRKGNQCCGWNAPDGRHLVDPKEVPEHIRKALDPENESQPEVSP